MRGKERDGDILMGFSVRRHEGDEEWCCNGCAFMNVNIHIRPGCRDERNYYTLYVIYFYVYLYL